MALSMAYAIMDNGNPNELNQDLLFFYYGTWFKSGPIDIGRTTITALKSFRYDTHCINSKRNFQCGVYKIIKTLNSESLSNGFYANFPFRSMVLLS